MLRLRLVERPNPTGSRDPDVLLAWLLDALGLVRRRRDGFAVEEAQGALHRLLREHLLAEPLRGWDSRSLSAESGLSTTALHHQMTKLVQSGLVSASREGRWHRHVIRNGSLGNALVLLRSASLAVLDQRLATLDGVIQRSKDRMLLTLPEGTDDDVPFRIDIAECGPRTEGCDDLDALLNDLGLDGDRPTGEDRLARRVLVALAVDGRPLSMQALIDVTEASRPRLQRILDRMRAAAMVERVPLADRLPQDVFAGMMRQRAARGDEWLLGRGGVGRLDEEARDALMGALADGSLTIDGCERILEEVPLQQRLLLLNTLGGRVPYGHRLTGIDGGAIRARVMHRAERVLDRAVVVGHRLDESLREECPDP